MIPARRNIGYRDADTLVRDAETNALVRLLDLLSEWTGGNISSRAAVATQIREAAETYGRISGYRSEYAGPLYRGTAIPDAAYSALREWRPFTLQPRTLLQSWTSSETQAGYFAADANEDRPAVVLAMDAERLTVLAGLDELYRRLPEGLRDRYQSFRAGDGANDENEFIVLASPVPLDGSTVVRLLDDPWDEGCEGEDRPSLPSP